MPGTAKAAPAVFRILIPAKDLEASRQFYERLLGAPGRLVAGGRVYFDCGPVILGILNYSKVPAKDWSAPTEAIYFSTRDLAGLHARARELGALDTSLIHGDVKNPAGEIVVRPWGELSFYANDPSGNPLCFVDEATRFTGTPAQVAALAAAPGARSTVAPPAAEGAVANASPTPTHRRRGIGRRALDSKQE
ncbi:MAG: VOC family protein [Thermoplasmata archaeon]|nr:VOC family protein [Thermoplasmata archaeon]MCI4356980.1 VOC family protein [Thermoplasmata archaeon]